MKEEAGTTPKAGGPPLYPTSKKVTHVIWNLLIESLIVALTLGKFLKRYVNIPQVFPRWRFVKQFIEVFMSSCLDLLMPVPLILREFAETVKWSHRTTNCLAKFARGLCLSVCNILQFRIPCLQMLDGERAYPFQQCQFGEALDSSFEGVLMICCSLIFRGRV